MAETIKQTEALPETYPTVTAYPHRQDWEGEIAMDAGIIWQRIESYIAHRWTPREVVWIIEGTAGDEWTSPLVPLVSHTAERWDGSAWASVTLLSGPLGLCLPSDGTYKVTAQVGAGELPAGVEEAFWRLHEYSLGIADQFKNEASYRTMGDTEVSPNWASKAIILSGAADLLRPYRRA